MNAMGDEECREILESFAVRARMKMQDRRVYIGVSDQIRDIENLHVAYRRARAAVEMAEKQEMDIQYFDRMGLYRMLYMVEQLMLQQETS